MEKEKVILVQHLKKHFRQQKALDNLSFEVKAGEIFGFLGPSGAGKTTLIKILTGQLMATSGEAEVLGIPVGKIKEEIYQNIGIVTDNSGLYEGLSVYENLLFFAKILKVENVRVNEVLAEVGLYDHRKKKAKQLSKGMKQRLILARAILHKPRVLFLDEPTSGLDPTTAVAIHDLLLTLKNNGTAIFLTTHNMTEATKLCDEVALLNEGMIAEMGAPQALCVKHQSQKAYRVLLEDGRQEVLRQSPDDLQQLSEWLQNNQVATCHSCEPTLEDVFLKITGKALFSEAKGNEK